MSIQQARQTAESLEQLERLVRQCEELQDASLQDSLLQLQLQEVRSRIDVLRASLIPEPSMASAYSPSRGMGKTANPKASSTRANNSSKNNELNTYTVPEPEISSAVESLPMSGSQRTSTLMAASQLPKVKSKWNIFFERDKEERSEEALAEANNDAVKSALRAIELAEKGDDSDVIIG